MKNEAKWILWRKRKREKTTQSKEYKKEETGQKKSMKKVFRHRWNLHMSLCLWKWTNEYVVCVRYLKIYFLNLQIYCIHTPIMGLFLVLECRMAFMYNLSLQQSYWIISPHLSINTHTHTQLECADSSFFLLLRRHSQKLIWCTHIKC